MACRSKRHEIQVLRPNQPPPSAVQHIGSEDADAPKVFRLFEPPYQRKPLTSGTHPIVASTRPRCPAGTGSGISSPVAPSAKDLVVAVAVNTNAPWGQVGAEERTRARRAWGTLLSDSSTPYTSLIAFAVATRASVPGASRPKANRTAQILVQGVLHPR